MSGGVDGHDLVLDESHMARSQGAVRARPLVPAPAARENPFHREPDLECRHPLDERDVRLA
jgi:hypothetical protein